MIIHSSCGVTYAAVAVSAKVKMIIIGIGGERLDNLDNSNYNNNNNNITIAHILTAGIDEHM
jgi:hypothetical protein